VSEWDTETNYDDLIGKWCRLKFLDGKKINCPRNFRIYAVSLVSKLNHNLKGEKSIKRGIMVYIGTRKSYDERRCWARRPYWYPYELAYDISERVSEESEVES